MRHAGRVVTKTELLDHVWDAARRQRAERGRGLRRLPAAQARPATVLETVRGAGYRLVAA